MSHCIVKAWSSRMCPRGTKGCVAPHKDDMNKNTESISIEDVLTDEDRRRIEHSRKAAFDHEVQDDDPDPDDVEDE